MRSKIIIHVQILDADGTEHMESTSTVYPGGSRDAAKWYNAACERDRRHINSISDTMMLLIQMKYKEDHYGSNS